MPQPATSKPVLAVDIDDTMVTSEAALAAYHNHLFPEMPSVLGGFYEFDFENADPGYRKKITEEITKLLKSDEFYKLQPEPGSQSAIKKLGQKYHLVLITARPSFMQKRTVEWIEQHFEGRFQESRFVGADVWGHVNLRATKKDALKELQASIFIEDSLKHVTDAAKLGIRGVLFGDYTWNRTDDLPKGVVRAKDWAEVEKILL